MGTFLILGPIAITDVAAQTQPKSTSAIGLTQAGSGLPNIVGSSTAGDFNEDGILDLLLTGYAPLGPPLDPISSTVTRVYLGDGNNGFQRASTDLIGVRNGCGSVGDVNLDGHADILIAGLSFQEGIATPITALYYGDGTGGFERSSVDLIGVGHISESTSCDIGYLGGGSFNTSPDLLVSGKDASGTPTTTAYFGDGNGEFSRRDTSILGVSDGDNVIGDFNDDGFTDIIVNGRAPDAEFYYATALYHGDGTGDFELKLSGLAGSYTGSITTLDVTTDNPRPDALITGRNDNEGGPISILHAPYAGNLFGFLYSSDVLVGVERSASAAGYFSLDGTPDLVISSLSADGPRTSVYLGNDPFGGDSVTFQEVPTEMWAMVDGSITVGDYDRDGDLDVLMMGSEQNGLSAPFTRLYVNRAQQSGPNRAPG